ncbi:hypothetical protein STCU_01546 [Strigomonas culicis]|uniref:Uncharacterized protein n=1 Tax=Strigomonas culicis TaxID=28005 RepID=S9UUA1_9TRYP|nr:hypothetical protein STCU_01546 [Strigomonas culicis]|eukprot:EPY34517.1 hypothetical protein STCU_01546 [Strigomonas culicis]
MEAVDLFVKSLSAPSNYEEEATQENGFVIPYSTTDDYADFTALEAILDDEINRLQEAFLACAVSDQAPSKAASEAGSRRPSVAGDAAPPSARSPRGDEDRAQRRRRLLLRLLFLTLHVGRLEALCHIDEIHEDADQVVAAAEELKEEVAQLWQWVTLEHRPYVLSAEEREEWRFILETYIGAPFCAAA